MDLLIIGLHEQVSTNFLFNSIHLKMGDKYSVLLELFPQLSKEMRIIRENENFLNMILLARISNNHFLRRMSRVKHIVRN